jgi:hypothetical protein
VNIGGQKHGDVYMNYLVSRESGESVYSQISKALRIEINQYYKPGDCLPPEPQLAAVFQLFRLADVRLADAVRLVTANPANAAGCHDRGAIEVGKKADLVSVRLIQEMPCVSHLWVNGDLKYQQRI